MILKVDNIAKHDDIQIIFNDKFCFGYSDIEETLENESPQIDEGFKEFLPGVFVKVIILRSTNTEKDTRFISRITEFIRTINRRKLLYIKIENRRDYILIKQKTCTGGYKILFETDINENRGAFFRLNFYKRLGIKQSEWECVGVKKDYVDPKDISFYPNSVRTGAGCKFEEIPLISDLLGYYTSRKYELLSLEEIMTTSAETKEYGGFCLNFEHCAALREKLTDGSYDINFDDSKHVGLIEYNGVFFVGEGKHRVCIAKRFSISRLFAVIFTMKRNSNYHNNENDDKRMIRNSSFSIDILNDYYKQMARLNISKIQARNILKSGIYGIHLIKYIQQASKC